VSSGLRFVLCPDPTVLLRYELILFSVVLQAKSLGLLGKPAGKPKKTSRFIGVNWFSVERFHK
jgi:hypothetical protein